MPNGFGYTPPGQKPPDPSQVGEMLMRPRGVPEQPQATQMPQMGMGQPQQAVQAPDEAMRMAGGKLMGGGGDNGRIEAAVGEALTRAGGGHRPNPNPHKNREGHIRQLQRLGLSEVEAMLLGDTL